MVLNPSLIVKNRSYLVIAFIFVSIFIFSKEVNASVPTVGGVNIFQKHPDDIGKQIGWCTERFATSTTVYVTELTDVNGYKYWEFPAYAGSGSSNFDLLFDHSPDCTNPHPTFYQTPRGIPDDSSGNWWIYMIMNDRTHSISSSDVRWYDAVGSLRSCSPFSVIEEDYSFGGEDYTVRGINCALRQSDPLNNMQGGWLEEIQDLIASGSDNSQDLYYFTYAQASSTNDILQISNSTDLQTFMDNLNNESFSGSGSTTAYIGDTTRFIDLNLPAYKTDYATNTIQLQFNYYQSQANEKADYFKVDYKNVNTGVVYTEYGNVDNSSFGELVSTSYHTLPDGQYSCSISLYADEVTFAFVGTVTDYKLDEWYGFGSCLFNLNVTNTQYPFPSSSGIFNFSSTTDDINNTSFFDTAVYFLENLLKNKHPFAWPYETLNILKQASMYEQTYEDLTIALDFIPSITHATSSSDYFDFVQYQDIVTSLGSYDINFIDSGCNALIFDDIDMCDQFRDIQSYMFYLSLMLFYGYLMMKFFNSEST